jgi:hypothetical protein
MGSGLAPVTTLAAAFQQLTDAFDRLKVLFLAGGSVSSSIHGVPRQTNNIDVVAELTARDVPRLSEKLTSVFYLDQEFAQRAIEAGRPFNVIHIGGACKFDIFPSGQDPFARSEMSRRRTTASLIPGLENVQFPVSSPEDTILAKLCWFRQGGEVSDRQWHDVLGLVRVQAQRLDLEYLTHWAAELGVADLLRQVLP